MSDTSNEFGSPPRAGGDRKPVIIDLPAQEVGRSPDESADATDESSAMRSGSSGTERPDVYPETTDTEAARIRSEAEDDLHEAATSDAPASAPSSATEPAFAAESVPPVAPARRRRAGTFAALLLAALLGGAIAAGGTALLAREGYLDLTAPAADAPDYAAEIAALRSEMAALGQGTPAAGPDIAPLQAQVTQLEQAIGELRRQPGGGAAAAPALQEVQSRLAQLEQATAAGTSGAPDPALEARLAELSTQIDQLRGAAGAAAEPALAGLAGRIDEIAARINATAGEVQSLQGRPPVDLSGVEASIAQANTQITELAQRVDAAPTEERVAALEAGLASVQAAMTELSARGERTDLLGHAVAAGALADAVQAGAPFTAELAALRTLGFDAAALDALQPFAESGLPTLAELQSSFETAAAAADVSTPAAEDAGAVERLLQSARGLVEVRPAASAGGTDAAAILARMRGALQAGDLQRALTERDTLPADAKIATEDWARTAQARLAADNLVAQLRIEALSRLGTQG